MPIWRPVSMPGSRELAVFSRWPWKSLLWSSKTSSNTQRKRNTFHEMMRIQGRKVTRTTHWSTHGEDETWKNFGICDFLFTFKMIAISRAINIQSIAGLCQCAFFSLQNTYKKSVFIQEEISHLDYNRVSENHVKLLSSPWTLTPGYELIQEKVYLAPGPNSHENR